jgi:hypothetical protein
MVGEACSRPKQFPRLCGVLCIGNSQIKQFQLPELYSAAVTWYCSTLPSGISRILICTDLPPLNRTL